MSKSQDNTTIKVRTPLSIYFYCLWNYFYLKNIIGIKKTLEYCNWCEKKINI
jgi:hypothetical protein